MKCPNCQSEETRIDCIRSEISCKECGLILSASHTHVGDTPIKLPYGFRTGFRPCTEKYDTEYHADWNYQSIKEYSNHHYGEYHTEDETIERKPYNRWE